MRLAGEGAELGVEWADVCEADGVLVAVVDERDLSLLLDGRRAADLGAVPLAVGELGRYKVASSGGKAGWDSDGLVVEGEVTHEFFEGRDALCVEDLDRECEGGLCADVADDDIEVLGLQRGGAVLCGDLNSLLGVLVVVLPDLSSACQGKGPRSAAEATYVAVRLLRVGLEAR